MEKKVIDLGVFFLALFIFVIPILTTCSFIYQWNGLIQTVLFIASSFDILGISALICGCIENEKTEKS